MTRGIRQALAPVMIAAGLISAWEITLRLAHVPGYVLPRPSAIVQKAVSDWPVLATGIATTMAEAGAGFLLGNLIGFALAVALFYRPALRRVAMLPMVAANSVPAVAFAPVVILWLGSGMASKIVLVAFITAFIMLQNELQGLRQVDAQAVNVLRSFGAREGRIFWMLRFPASLPYLFTALRLGSIRSVIIAIVAEMLGAYRGIGWVIFETTASMDYSRLWAAVAAASMAGVLFFALVSALERRWVWWHVSVSGMSRRTRQYTRGNA
jgi:NitT/TauT family transport system permease protein